MLEMENRQISLKQNTLEILEHDLKKSALYIKIHKTETGLTESEWSELGLLIERLIPISQNVFLTYLHMSLLKNYESVTWSKLAFLLKRLHH